MKCERTFIGVTRYERRLITSRCCASLHSFVSISAVVVIFSLLYTACWRPAELASSYMHSMHYTYFMKCVSMRAADASTPVIMIDAEKNKLYPGNNLMTAF